MEQASQSDSARLLDFVRDCYAIRDFEPFERFPARLVAALSRLIPSLHTSYAEVSPATREFFHVSSAPEISVPAIDSLLLQYMNGHLPLVHYMQTGDRSTLRFSDFLSQRQFHDTGFYCGFYRQYGVEDDLCLGIDAGSGRSTSIAWHSDRGFTDREQSLASLARPHIIQAWENAQLISQTRSQNQALNSGLEGAALGVISCNSEGRVQFTTALARQYLAHYFGAARNVDRELPLELHRWVRRRCAQLKSNEIQPVELPFTVRKAERRLTVRLLSSAGSILLLLEEKRPSQGLGGLEEYSLSPRESEVLAWAARGKTNSEIAAILGISLTTAKKHMEHILHKLQVETRTAAAAIALQSLSRKR